MSDKSKGILYSYVTALGYGSCTVIADIVMRGGISTLTLMFFRNLVCILILLAINTYRLLITRTIQIELKLCLQTILLGAVIYASQSACYFTAVRHNPAALTTVIYSAYPLIIPLMTAVMYHTKINLKMLFTMLAAMFGLVLMMDTTMEGFTVFGTVLGILSVTGYSLYIVIGSRIGTAEHTLDPLQKAMCIFLGAWLVFGVYGVGTSGIHIDEAVSNMGGILVIAVCCTITPMCAFWSSVRLIGAEKASIAGVLEPISGVMLAIVLLSECLSLLQFAGILIVIAAIILAQKL